MGTIIEGLYDQEGFGAHPLLRHVASCGCGWQGQQAYPPTEKSYESAVEDWERSHARPLPAETVPAPVDTAIRDAKQAIGDRRSPS